MGSANLHTGWWTGDKRWDLERYVREAGHRFRWNPVARSPMSAIECAGHFLAWFDTRSCPSGSLLGLTHLDVERYSNWRGKGGLLWTGMVRAGMIDGVGTNDVSIHDYKAFNAKRVQGRIKKWMSNGGMYRGTCPHCLTGKYAPPQRSDVRSPESRVQFAASSFRPGESGESLNGVPLALIEAATECLAWAGSPQTVATALGEVLQAPGEPSEWAGVGARLAELGDSLAGKRPFDMKRLLLARPRFGCSVCTSEFLTGDMANWTDSDGRPFPDGKARCWSCAQTVTT